MPHEAESSSTELSASTPLSYSAHLDATTADNLDIPWTPLDIDNNVYQSPYRRTPTDLPAMVPAPEPKRLTDTNLMSPAQFATGEYIDTVSAQPANAHGEEVAIDSRQDVQIPAGMSTDEEAIEDLMSPIRDRWLYPVFSTQPTTCDPEKSTVQFYGQILRTYPQMMVSKDQLPPIIHPWQLSTKPVPLPLANCFSLVRLWEGRADGAGQLIDETVGREMKRLLNEVCRAFSYTLTACQ